MSIICNAELPVRLAAHTACVLGLAAVSAPAGVLVHKAGRHQTNGECCVEHQNAPAAASCAPAQECCCCKCSALRALHDSHKREIQDSVLPGGKVPGWFLAPALLLLRVTVGTYQSPSSKQAWAWEFQIREQLLP